MSSNNGSWTRTWTRGIDSGKDLFIDSQDYIYVVGYTYRYSEESDISLLKYNRTGVLIWSRIWSHEGKGSSIAIDDSENIYIAGNKNEDAFIMKCDNQGEEIWNRTWGGSNNEWCYGILIDSLNDIYIIGETLSFGFGSYDGFIAKYNSSGSLLWDVIWGTSESETFNDITIDDIDNIYVAGQTESNAVLIKFNSSGTELWNLTVDYYSWSQAIKIDSENNIIYATGHLLQKFSASGSIIWIRPLPDVDFLGGLAIDEDDNIYVLEQREITCPPDNLYFGGISQCICLGIYLEKYNETGALIWEKRCTGCVSASGEGIFLDSVNDIYICGTLYSTTGCGNINDILLIKNPTNHSEICYEIYYDLIILGIVIPGIIILAMIFLIIKKRKS
ncbi:MAG: hypothetical protein ACFE9Z_05510 [Promethearchaeota archaeon]